MPYNICTFIVCCQCRFWVKSAGMHMLIVVWWASSHNTSPVGGVSSRISNTSSTLDYSECLDLSNVSPFAQFSAVSLPLVEKDATRVLTWATEKSIKCVSTKKVNESKFEVQIIQCFLYVILGWRPLFHFNSRSESPIWLDQWQHFVRSDQSEVTKGLRLSKEPSVVSRRQRSFLRMKLSASYWTNRPKGPFVVTEAPGGMVASCYYY